MSSESLPELHALDTRRSLVRIPHECDVPLTNRVRRLLDSPQMRRLARISQLGLVGLVYPGACHSRFEHSLGVYRNALVYLKQLGGDERFRAIVGAKDAEALLAAALLHDLGHWPFCHAIEDMALAAVPKHERFAREFLVESEIADALVEDWNLQPEDVAALLSQPASDRRHRLLKSLLSGPIDIDKMDYLHRDSLHAGVPYGRNFDQQRLIGSLCLNQAGDGLAISHKGRTAAEMMVFARYVMFSEVYWHHAVRAATAMLQRAFYMLHEQLDLMRLFRLAEQPFIDELLDAAGERRTERLGDDASVPATELLSGLFGPTRRLYKRLAEFSHFQQRPWYERIARQPYPWLVAASEALASELSERLGRPVAPHYVLIDAPPVRREVEFDVEVHFPGENVYRTLAEVSPAVHTLATRQFDDFVKRVRIFVHPSIAAERGRIGPLNNVFEQALARLA